MAQEIIDWREPFLTLISNSSTHFVASFWFRHPTLSDLAAWQHLATSEGSPQWAPLPPRCHVGKRQFHDIQIPLFRHQKTAFRTTSVLSSLTRIEITNIYIYTKFSARLSPLRRKSCSQKQTFLPQVRSETKGERANKTEVIEQCEAKPLCVLSKSCVFLTFTTHNMLHSQHVPQYL